MSQSLPDYVPSPPRERILSVYGERGLRGLADAVKLPYHTVVHVFKRNNHQNFTAFMELADKLGVPADDLADVLDVEVGSRKEFLERLLEREVDNIKDFTGEADDYLYGIVRGQCGKQIKRVYRPITKKLSLNLSDLYSSLVGS